MGFFDRKQKQAQKILIPVSKSTPSPPPTAQTGEIALPDKNTQSTRKLPMSNIHLTSIIKKWEYKPKTSVRNMFFTHESHVFMFSTSQAKKKPNIIVVDQNGNELLSVENQALKIGYQFTPIFDGNYFIGYHADRIKSPDNLSEDQWNSVLALVNKNGDFLWKVDFPGEQITHVRYYAKHNYILCGTRKNAMIGQGSLYCYDFSGNFVWKYSKTEADSGSDFFPYNTNVLENNNMILVNHMNQLYALDSNGGRLWKRTFESTSRSPGIIIMSSSPINNIGISKSGNVIGIIYGQNIDIINNRGQVIYQHHFDSYLCGIFFSDSGSKYLVLAHEVAYLFQEGNPIRKFDIKGASQSVAKFMENKNLFIIGSRDKRLRMYNLMGEQIWEATFESGIVDMLLSEDGKRFGVLTDRYHEYALEFGPEKKVIDSILPEKFNPVRTDKVNLLWSFSEKLLKGGSISTFSISKNGDVALLYNRDLWLISSTGQLIWKKTAEQIISGYGRQIDLGGGRYTLDCSLLSDTAISEDGEKIWVSTFDRLIWEPARLIKLNRNGDVECVVKTETVVTDFEALPNHGARYETYNGKVSEFNANYVETTRHQMEGKIVEIDGNGRITNQQPICKSRSCSGSIHKLNLLSNDRELKASTSDGNCIWTFATPAKINDMDVYGERGLVLIRAGVNLFLLNTDGNQIWKKRIGKGAIYSGFNRLEQKIFTLSEENGISIIDLGGNVLKDVPFKVGKHLSLVDCSDNLFLIESGDEYDRYIYIVDNVGNLLLSMKTDGFVNGGFYIGGYCIISTGKLFNVYHIQNI